MLLVLLLYYLYYFILYMYISTLVFLVLCFVYDYIPPSLFKQDLSHQSLRSKNLVFLEFPTVYQYIVRIEPRVISNKWSPLSLELFYFRIEFTSMSHAPVPQAHAQTFYHTHKLSVTRTNFLSHAQTALHSITITPRFVLSIFVYLTLYIIFTISRTTSSIFLWSENI